MANSPAMVKAREFLSLKRIAVIGVTRKEKGFSRYILRELITRGYDAVPVNPMLKTAEGRACFGRVQDISPPVDGALVLTNPAHTDAVVNDCIQAKVRMVWMHRGQGAGTATPTAVEACKKNGIAVVTDLCPFMAFPDSGWPHRVHGFFRRLGRRS